MDQPLYGKAEDRDAGANGGPHERKVVLRSTYARCFRPIRGEVFYETCAAVSLVFAASVSLLD